MKPLNKCLFVLVIIASLSFYECARSGGYRGRGGGSKPRTTSRPRYSSGTTARYRSSTYSSGSRTTGQSSYNPKTTGVSRYSSTTRRSYTSTTRRAYTTANWNNVPPRPGQTHINGNQQPQKIKIVNKYNYHYPGYYSIPMASSHPGYFYTPSSYHYSSSSTGSGVLGFFLGYSLAKLTTPTYSHQSFYDGYRPRYDHYEVHHYYHNKDSIPKNQEIKSNTIVGCVGDSVTICPSNTTSLCTSSGTLMCVVAATSTVPCTDNQQVNCVKSTISCVNNTAPECKNQNSTSVNIPCVSNAQIFGNLNVVNNTIVADNRTIGDIPLNATTPPTSMSANSTSTTSTTTAEPLTSTRYPITTTPSPTDLNRSKRDTPQNYCITILAVPAVKAPTEGEEFYQEAKTVISSFFDAVWN